MARTATDTGVGFEAQGDPLSAFDRALAEYATDETLHRNYR